MNSSMFLYSRDARLVDPLTIVSIALVYVGIVFWFRKPSSPALPTKDKAATSTNAEPAWAFILGVHNALLLALSVIMMLGSGKTVLHEIWAGNHLFCDSGSIYWGPHASNLSFWLYVFFLSKVYELLDTALLVLRGRPVKLLHWYHHVLTLIVCWVGNETQTTYSIYAMLSNTMVHSLMYFYYAYHSFTGKRLWWARYLTLLQLGQFATNAILMCVWVYLDQTVEGGCSGNYWGIAVCMWAMVSYFLLFKSMYSSRYNSKEAITMKRDLQSHQVEARKSPAEGHAKAG